MSKVMLVLLLRRHENKNMDYYIGNGNLKIINHLIRWKVR